MAIAQSLSVSFLPLRPSRRSSLPQAHVRRTVLTAGRIHVRIDSTILPNSSGVTWSQQSPNPTHTGEPDAIDLPPRTALRPNTPNPFNPATTIHFDLAQEGPVSLEVYDVAGRRVRVLVNKTMPAGFDRQVTWNGWTTAAGVCRVASISPDSSPAR